MTSHVPELKKSLTPLNRPVGRRGRRCGGEEEASWRQRSSFPTTYPAANAIPAKARSRSRRRRRRSDASLAPDRTSSRAPRRGRRAGTATPSPARLRRCRRSSVRARPRRRGPAPSPSSRTMASQALQVLRRTGRGRSPTSSRRAVSPTRARARPASPRRPCRARIEATTTYRRSGSAREQPADAVEVVRAVPDLERRLAAALEPARAARPPPRPRVDRPARGTPPPRRPRARGCSRPVTTTAPRPRRPRDAPPTRARRARPSPPAWTTASFSAAISSRVSPSSSVCSSPTFVRTTTGAREDVRRVEPPAEPRLDDRRVDALLGELGERGRGQRLELRRAERARPPAGRARPPLESLRRRCRAARAQPDDVR